MKPILLIFWLTFDFLQSTQSLPVETLKNNFNWCLSLVKLDLPGRELPGQTSQPVQNCLCTQQGEITPNVPIIRAADLAVQTHATFSALLT